MERCTLLLRVAVLGAVLVLSTAPLNAQFPLLQYDLSILDVKSGEISKVTSLNGSGEFNPSWSNDRKYIVHDVVTNTSHDLFVTEIATGTSIPLSGGEGGNDGVWSPNGQWIAFDRFPSGDNNVYRVPAAGGPRLLVVSDAISPEWSPDSRRLVFQRPSDGSVRVVGIDGTGEVVVAPSGSFPSWSPNGQWIAYSFAGDIWKVRVRASGEPVTASVALTGQPGFEGHPTWSNNSATIVFQSDAEGDFDLWTVTSSGGTVSKLAGEFGVGEFDPAFSKNGQYVVFASFTPLPLTCDIPTSEEHDFNDVRLSVGTAGTSGFPPGGHGYYPRIACDQYIFSLGILVGGIVNGRKTTFEAMYQSEAVPSEIGSTGTPFRVFNSMVAGDVANWPPEFSDAGGTPIIVPQAQNLVVEYNDINGFPRREAGRLEVEVRQRSLEYDDPQKRAAVLYVWEVINRSARTVEDVCFGVWLDADIGGGTGYTDDRANEINGMGIIWDQDFSESDFLFQPAIVGFDFLESPFPSEYISGLIAGSPFSDPIRDSTQYNYIAGLQHGEWHLTGDARILQSTGMFDLAPGESFVVAGALIFGRVPPGTTSLALLPSNRPDPADPILADLLQVQENVKGFYNASLSGQIPSSPLNKRDVALGPKISIPAEFGLNQNFPNPFNPATEIRFTLPADEHVTLKIYSALGEEVAVVEDGFRRAGAHTVIFNANDLPSGVYYARLQAGSLVQVRKLLLVK